MIGNAITSDVSVCGQLGRAPDSNSLVSQVTSGIQALVQNTNVDLDEFALRVERETEFVHRKGLPPCLCSRIRIAVMHLG